MYIDFKKIINIVLLVSVGVVIGVSATKMITRFQAPKQTVSVTGTGEIEATTDQANIGIVVKTISTTYEKAQEENKADVESLKGELKNLGIPESRITVSSYSQPIYIEATSESFSYDGSGTKMMPPSRPTIKTPTITTNLNLVIDPIKNIEKIFDVVSNNASAQITNTYYSLKDRKTWESKAKEEALKDIRAQIESVAKINHLKVGKLRTLVDGENPRPYPMALKAMDSGSASSGQEIVSNNQYSEQTVKITSSYTATYELY